MAIHVQRRAFIGALGSAADAAHWRPDCCGRAMLISGRCHCGNISFFLDWLAPALVRFARSMAVFGPPARPDH
jgi:hypothetical protein